jgi:hypothetical protein
LKNTKIRWDIRGNFKGHTTTDVNFPNVHGVVPTKEGAKLYSGVKPETFYDTFKPVPLMAYRGDKVECVKIDFGYGVKIGLNKEYLDIGLMCLGGEFDLYVRGPLQPLTLESKDTTVLLLPVRHSEASQ